MCSCQPASRLLTLLKL
ncbi:hypothetical protein pdam_00012495 [Pocillopora damicornis]|uniref:Uncharacterized protein n=1 Tax=Pocillopora damicornis TaxID=46731 RepID=A0A3M6TKG3_POCDA|nr:hypothetical protein pdam_00012495 [Pocillopora damicornis]